jgi:hypothetical protein
MGTNGPQGQGRELLANMQERDLSKLGWPELCPVVFAVPGGRLVVMRRALRDVESPAGHASMIA